MLDSIIKYFQSTLQSILTGTVSNLLLFTVVYIVIWVILAKVLKTRKIQLSKRAGKEQITDEIFNIILVIIANTLFISIVYILRDSGMTKVYTDIGKYGLWYEFFAVFFLVVLNDAWFYFIHRLMHSPKVYKYVHAVHHKSLDTDPFTSQSFHVLETILLTLWIIPAVLLMPLSLFSIGITQVLGMFNNIKGHLGYELYPKFFAYVPIFNGLATSTHHNLHHTQYNGNYGLFFRFWDLALGTELKDTMPLFKQIHERKYEETTVVDNSKYQQLTISKLVKETKDTISIYFEPTNQEWYNHLAGQYLNVRIKVDGKNYDRSFSLSSSPLDNFLRITVKLNGVVSHWFYNQAKVGDNIQALLPVGDFVIKPNPVISKNYLFVAGGSGITPLFAMINTLLVQEPKSKITLFYSSKTIDSTIFYNQLSSIQGNNPEQLNIQYFLTGKRFSKDDFRNYVATNSNFDTYICGPLPLKDSAKNYLKDLKINSDSVYSEDFADGYVPWFGLIK